MPLEDSIYGEKYQADFDNKAFNETLEYLKEHGSEIGTAAREGNSKAEHIISLYVMAYGHLDVPTAGLLTAAVDEWKRLQTK
jgi:hypothetical protein